MREVSSIVDSLLNKGAHHEVTELGKGLSTTILKDEYDAIKARPNCLSANFLNHWVNDAPVEDDPTNVLRISLSTQLDNNESTLSDFKSSVVDPDINNFKDSMLPVLKAFIKFMYYMELGKQWATPINPLNLIYVDNGPGQEGNIKAFYHENGPIQQVDADFLNDLIKMMYYLFVPEEHPNPQLYSGDYPNGAKNSNNTPKKVDANYYANELDNNPNYTAKYDPEDLDDLANFAYNLQTDKYGNPPIHSVKDVFITLGIVSEANDIEKEDGVVDAPAPDNLTNYLSPAEEAAKAAQLKKEQEQHAAEEAAKNDPKLQKQKQLEEMKKKQEEEKRQKQAEKEQQQKQLEQQKAEQEAKRKAKKKQEAEDAENKRKKNLAAAEELKKKKAADKDARRKAKLQAKIEKAEAKRKMSDTLPITKQTWFRVCCGVLVIGGFIGIGFAWHNHNVKVAEEQAAKVRNDRNPLKSPYFNSGAQASGAQNYKAAAPDFDKFFEAGGKLSDLNNNQIGSVFAAYLNTSQYQKILDNIGSPQTATALVNYLTGRKELKTVNNLQSKLSIITLSKAVINNDYAEVTQQANNVDVSQNGVLQLDICKAYAKTKKLADGRTWADAQKNSSALKKAIVTYALNNGMKKDVIEKEMNN